MENNQKKKRTSNVYNVRLPLWLIARVLAVQQEYPAVNLSELIRRGLVLALLELETNNHNNSNNSNNSGGQDASQ